MQISKSAVRRSLQLFSLSEKCRMMNFCRCQDKGGTFSWVILSHWVLHLHCLVSRHYSAPDSNPPSITQKFDTQPVYLTSRQIKAFSWLLSWGVRNRKSRKRADISCCSPHALLNYILVTFMQAPSPVQTGVTRWTREALRVETATSQGTIRISSVLLSKFICCKTTTTTTTNNSNIYCALDTEEGVK